MLRQLTRESLHGVWAAIATPFSDDGRIDFGVLRENIGRLHGAGVHGIYTTDSDGEFYGIELDEFKVLVKAFAKETQRLGVPSQVGVTWCNTDGMIARLRIAADAGILGAHVGHPFFMPMTAESYRRFWDDMQSAIPDKFALIHYNTPRVHNYLAGADYAVLSKDVEALVGTKHVGADFPAFCDVVGSAPELSHFTSEHSFTPFSLTGARGIYSWFVNFNPTYMLEWYAEAARGDWRQASARQMRMAAFMRAMDMFHAPGNLHAIVGKAVTAASDFLVPNNRTRRPYLPIADELIQQFRTVVERDFADMLWVA
jgi:4-hydroxy-tetrahydrodipicolinate synthase